MSKQKSAKQIELEARVESMRCLLEMGYSKWDYFRWSEALAALREYLEKESTDNNQTKENTK